MFPKIPDHRLASDDVNTVTKSRTSFLSALTSRCLSTPQPPLSLTLWLLLALSIMPIKWMWPFKSSHLSGPSTVYGKPTIVPEWVGHADWLTSVKTHPPKTKEVSIPCRLTEKGCFLKEKLGSFCQPGEGYRMPSSNDSRLQLNCE